MVNIFAPTPRTKPSACVQVGHSVFCRNILILQKIGSIKSNFDTANLYIVTYSYVYDTALIFNEYQFVP